MKKVFQQLICNDEVTESNKVTEYLYDLTINDLLKFSYR